MESHEKIEDPIVPINIFSKNARVWITSVHRRDGVLFFKTLRSKASVLAKIIHCNESHMTMGTYDTTNHIEQKTLVSKKKKKTENFENTPIWQSTTCVLHEAYCI